MYFARHGQSVANRDKILSAPDTPLTQLGIEQAHALGDSVADKNIELIIVSPDLRAIQTASIVLDHIDITSSNVHILDELHERRFGKLEGTLKPPEPNYAYTFDSDGGAETRDELIDRIKIVIKKLKPLRDQIKGNILIIGHSVAGYYMRELLAGHESYEAFSDDYNRDNAKLEEIDL